MPCYSLLLCLLSLSLPYSPLISLFTLSLSYSLPFLTPSLTSLFLLSTLNAFSPYLTPYFNSLCLFVFSSFLTPSLTSLFHFPISLSYSLSISHSLYPFLTLSSTSLLPLSLPHSFCPCFTPPFSLFPLFPYYLSQLILILFIPYNLYSFFLAPSPFFPYIFPSVLAFQFHPLLPIPLCFTGAGDLALAISRTKALLASQRRRGFLGGMEGERRACSLREAECGREAVRAEEAHVLFRRRFPKQRHQKEPLRFSSAYYL